MIREGSAVKDTNFIVPNMVGVSLGMLQVHYKRRLHNRSKHNLLAYLMQENGAGETD